MDQKRHGTTFNIVLTRAKVKGKVRVATGTGTATGNDAGGAVVRTISSVQ